MILENYNFKNFIDLSNDDLLEVLKWRNEENVRKWMYNSENISKDDHLSFINRLKEDNNNQYFILEKDDKYLGVIYFNKITSDSLEMGIYSNPKLKNVGKDLMRAIEIYSFAYLNVKKIISEVFIENKKAISLYKKFGFAEISEKVKNEKKVLILELINENR